MDQRLFCEISRKTFSPVADENGRARRRCGIAIAPTDGMGRKPDDLLQGLLKKMADGAPEPHRHRKRRRLIDEEPEGLFPPPRRPRYSGSPSPFEDPLRHIKRPLLAGTGPDRGGAHVEFSQVHIVQIRYKFHVTQRQFARMLGISLQTLMNWEQGKRRPHGPSRALLRVAPRTPRPWRARSGGTAGYGGSTTTESRVGVAPSRAA